MTSEPTPGFPVSNPTGVVWVYRAQPEPIIGPDAKQDLREIKRKHPLLARRLLRDVMALLDRQPSKIAEKIRDPPGVGPRYKIPLREGYVAVYWVLDPPPERIGAGPALWAERVALESVLEAAISAMAPAEPSEP